MLTSLQNRIIPNDLGVGYLFIPDEHLIYAESWMTELVYHSSLLGLNTLKIFGHSGQDFHEIPIAIYLALKQENLPVPREVGG